MAAASTALGAVIDRLAAYPPFAALAAGGIWTGEVPEEKPLPFVSLKDTSAARRALQSEGRYLEPVRLWLRAWALEGDAAGAENAAWAIVTAAEAALDQKELLLAVAGFDVVACKVATRQMGEEHSRKDDRRISLASANIELLLAKRVKP